MGNTIRKFKLFEKDVFVYLVMFLVVIGMLTGCHNQQGQENSGDFKGARESVSIALPEPPPNWLTIIAAEQGFFSRNGLDVTTKYYPSGKRSLLGMFKGDVNIATVAKVPVVFNSFERQDFSIISAIGSSNNDNKIVARKDSGIQKPDDLRGKRIATQKASTSHFLLHLFLVKNGILEKEIEISFMKVEELPGALERGKVDAISTREPFFSEAIDLLRDKAIAFTEPGLFNKTFVLVAFKDFISKKPHVIRRILSAIIQAEEFVRIHPEQANVILRNEITERKRAEGELTKITGELRERNEELERFHRITVGRELDMIRL